MTETVIKIESNEIEDYITTNNHKIFSTKKDKYKLNQQIEIKLIGQKFTQYFKIV